MPTYTVHAVNIGSFLLGEADKVITVFSAERGILRCVAKGARKPGTKMSGRSDVLSVNKLFLSSGRSFEIITQAECIETFPEFRSDLQRMSYALYYAELTQHFGQGVSDESDVYYDYLLSALQLQARSKCDRAWLCLEFELGLLDMLGYRPELTYCVSCRDVLGDYNLGTFNRDHGGILCRRCNVEERQLMARESSAHQGVERETAWREGTHITPLVWKNLVLASDRRLSLSEIDALNVVKTAVEQASVSRYESALQDARYQQLAPVYAGALQAARRLIQGYIEHRVGKRLKSLDLLDEIGAR